MRLAIVKIADRGAPNKERLYIRATGDTSLEYYIVFDTTYIKPDQISNIQRHAHWFLKKDVKAGDHIILYTRKGTPSEVKNADGTTTHFLFWGLETTIWNKSGDCAVLFEVSSWMTSAFE